MGLQVKTMPDKGYEKKNASKFIIYNLILAWKRLAIFREILDSRANPDPHGLANYQGCDTMAVAR